MSNDRNLRRNPGLSRSVTALALMAGLLPPIKAQNTYLSGVVRGTAGEPVAGALVKVKNEDRGLGFMVVSQEQGRYRTPSVPPGKYTIQAFGGTRQSAPSRIANMSGVQSTDIVLSAPLEIPP